MKVGTALCNHCGEEFTKPNPSSKSCSDSCRKAHRKTRKKISMENITVLRTCLFCSKDFPAIRCKPKKFCNRSCASKFYVKSGKYDSWVSSRERRPKFSTMTPCIHCQKPVLTPPRQKGKNKVCSKTCFAEHMKTVFPKGSGPMKGKTMTDGQKKKQITTLMKNHGVANAYCLAKRRKISKPQRELFEDIVSELGFQEAELERYVGGGYYADILLPNKKKVIEYHGDYWHCNPKLYSKEYYHKVKGIPAKEIWERDKQRVKSLKTLGFLVFVVWESDFKNKRTETLQSVKEFLGKENESATNKTS